MKNIILERDTFLELPMSLETFVPEDSLAREILEFISLFDLQSIEETYSSNNGRKGYNIYSMFAMIIYSYSQGIYSTRAMERQCKQNVIFMWIMEFKTPDHSTIHRFQQRIVGKEKKLSAEQIKILLKKELIDLSNISIDGTKIKSVANKYTNVYRGTVGFHERNLEEKIATAINKASVAVQNIELDNYDEAPENSSIDIPDNIKKISEINFYVNSNKPSKNMNKKYNPQITIDEIIIIVKWLITLDYEEVKKHKDIKFLYDEIDNIFLRKCKYIKQRAILGDRNSYSKTDEDACFMRMKNDSFDSKILSPGYNVHQGNSNGFILYFGVSNVSADTRQLPKFVELLEEIGAIKNDSIILADAGYGSLENYRHLQARNIKYLIPYMNQRFETKRKFINNPIGKDKFLFVDKKHAICPANQILEYTHSSYPISVNGFITEKDHYISRDCEGCKFVKQCSKNGKTRTITNDIAWEKEKRKQKLIFSEKENLSMYKKRTIVEQGFAIVKFNNKLERFRNYGIQMNMVILQLLAISCNIKRIHNYKKVNSSLKIYNINFYSKKFKNICIKNMNSYLKWNSYFYLFIFYDTLFFYIIY